MVIITNKNSNIVQDIETLHLFARLVGEVCRTPEEKEVTKNSFELLLAFDEVISLGYRENVNLQQIRTIIEMDSHEEKIQEIIARNQEQEAKEIQKRRAKQIEYQKRESMRRGMGMGTGGMGSMGGGTSFGGGGSSFGGAPSPRSSTFAEPTAQGTFGDSSSKSAAPSMPSAKGMQLGRKTKAADMFEAVKTDLNLEEPSGMGSGSGPTTPKVHTESVHVQIEEKIIVIANRDGGIQSMEVKGDLTLRVSDPEKAKIRLTVSSAEDENLQFKTHPNVNRNLFTSDHIITLKDANRPFPVNQPTGVLKWRYVTTDEGSIPLSINCWPTPSGDGSCDVNIEYELENEALEFTDVTITIPIPIGSTPHVGDLEGQYNFDRQHHQLDWQVAVINNNNRSGALEFSVPGTSDVNSFFPVMVNFNCTRSYLGIDVTEVARTEEGEVVTFSKECSLVPEEYSVV